MTTVSIPVIYIGVTRSGLKLEEECRHQERMNLNNFYAAFQIQRELTACIRNSVDASILRCGPKEDLRRLRMGKMPLSEPGYLLHAWNW